MLRKTDGVTAAARKFNDALDELIKLSDKYHPDEEMLRIAKRKLAFSRKIDMLLPVQLTWNNRLLKGHGEAILKRDAQYFIETSHTNLANFGGTRNDVTSDDINRILRMFRNEWSTKFDDDLKNQIWTHTQNIYKAYCDYGFAMRQ
jgi:hypothetical protein